ncbi:MAG: hypothetical protein WCD79_22415 [Chthoniobacteraceae bacterium]
MEPLNNDNITPKRWVSISLASIFLFFGLLWLLDFPKPFIDDLFYCGAGLNLAAGGDLSNPLLERHHFPGHYFFAYPPIHSYAIAGWMKLFGISARSLTGFQILMYLATALATISILRRYKSPAWLSFLVPLGVTASFLPFGLRPEPLSVALTMTGFAIIECGYSRIVPAFFAFLLMFLGGGTAPRLTLFSGVLVLIAGFRAWQKATGTGWKRWSFCLSALGAIFITFFIFLYLINFRLGEFWAMFHLHASYNVSGSRILLLKRFFFEILGVTQLPMFFLAALLLFFVGLKSRNELFYGGLLVASGFVLTALIGGIGIGATWYVFLIILCLAVSVSGNVTGNKIFLPATLSLVMLLANSKSLLNAAGVLSGEIQEDHVGQAAAIHLRPTTDHPVLVDKAVARYVFDYKIPGGFIDFAFSAPFPGFGVKDFFAAQDVYLVSPSNVDYLRSETQLDFPSPPKWAPLGLEKWSLEKHPYHTFVISAESCKGLRSDQETHR